MVNGGGEIPGAGGADFVAGLGGSSVTPRQHDGQRPHLLARQAADQQPVTALSGVVGRGDGKPDAADGALIARSAGPGEGTAGRLSRGIRRFGEIATSWGKGDIDDAAGGNGPDKGRKEPPKQPPPPHEVALAQFPEDRFTQVRAKIAEYIASIPDAGREITADSPLIQGLLLGFTEREVQGIEMKHRLQGDDPLTAQGYQEAIQRRKEHARSVRRFEQQKANEGEDLTLSDRDQAISLLNSSSFGHLWSGKLITDCYANIASDENVFSSGNPDIDELDLLSLEALDLTELYRARASEKVIADIRTLGRDAQLEDHLRVVERQITAARVAQGILYSVIEEISG